MIGFESFIFFMLVLIFGFVIYILLFDLYFFQNLIRKRKGLNKSFPAMSDQNQEIIDSHNLIYIGKNKYVTDTYKCKNCGAEINVYSVYAAISNFSWNDKKYVDKKCNDIIMEDVMQ